MVRSFCALVLVLFLSGCGAGAVLGTAVRIAQELDRPSGRKVAPPPRAPTPSLEAGTSNAPWVRNYRLLERGVDWWFIGTPNIGVDPDEIRINDYGGTTVTFERFAPSPSDRNTVERYLATVGATKRFASPPFIQLRNGRDEDFAVAVFRAVQIINSALPNDFQIGMDANTYTSSTGPPPGGVIRVEQSPKFSWGREWIIPSDLTHAEGAALRLYDVDSRYGSQVFIDTAVYAEEHLLRILVHELLHTMGLGGHFDYPNHSLMASSIYTNPEGLGTTIMFPMDIFGLRGFYDPESMGDWGKTRYAVGGCMDNDAICFGVQRIMGDANPWASNMGNTAHTLLSDNPTLSGTATWRGRLLGMTPLSEAVGGAAALTIALGPLTGDLDFTGLEYWRTGQAPGDVGSGTLWGDGDLTYGIVASGNIFLQDGTGDQGVVTGMFAGASHEYMTGVLERDDLAAGFGGRR